MCVSASLEQIYVNLFCDVRFNARSICVVVCNKSESSTIDPIEHVYVLVSVGVSHSCTVLKCWSNKCVVSHVFNVWSAFVKVPPQEPQGPICFVCDVVYVCV